MNNNPRRRWFRFSLRTMFIVVTVFACWIGWESSIVRKRKVALEEISDNPAFKTTTAEQWAQRFPPGANIAPPKAISFMRRLLGDEPIQEILITTYHKEFSREQLDRLKKEFPEAEVVELHPEPCHPGCFPSGTSIATPQGPRSVEQIAVGDYVTTVLANGKLATATVQSIFTTDNRLWQIETEDGTIVTTETQPLCTSATHIVPAGELKPGDSILLHRDDELHSAKVVSVTPTGRAEKVFNLVLGNSEVFIANGFLARSKPPAEDSDLR